MEHIKQRADQIIDTTDTSSTDLRRLISGQLSPNQRELNTHVMSFSFRKGIPREADMVFDARFLKNPHYVHNLNEMTGLDRAVGDYIQTDEGFATFFDNLTGLIMPLLPRFLEEGKSYLTIAVGCTGGKHRSVFTAEKLADYINENGYNAEVSHRDIPVIQRENIVIEE